MSKKKYPPKESDAAAAVRLEGELIEVLPPDPTCTSVSLDGETYSVQDGKLYVPLAVFAVLRTLGYREVRD